MSESLRFTPPRKRGLLIHGLLILVLAAASTLALVIGLNQPPGSLFVLLVLLALLFFAPLPWIAYRAFALARASYRMERDGLRLRWGLRAEDIPLPEIEWVRRPSDLPGDLPLPRFHWPGAILGTVNAPDLGPVEFLASSQDKLLLIATAQRVYAVSPEDPNAFMRGFQQALEMGSLTPFSSVSVLPAAYLVQVWSNPLARRLLIIGFVLNVLLFAGVGLLIPGRVSASLGFYPDGMPLPGVPAGQLILLPILGSFVYLVDLLTGLFFYRNEHYQLLAYLIWGSAVLTSGLLVVAVFLLALSA